MIQKSKKNPPGGVLYSLLLPHDLEVIVNIESTLNIKISPKYNDAGSNQDQPTTPHPKLQHEAFHSYLCVGQQTTLDTSNIIISRNQIIMGKWSCQGFKEWNKENEIW